MCGILGGFWSGLNVEIEKRVKDGLVAINHRGPDDNGYEIKDVLSGKLVLGHARLSIIDLSSAGHQPMVSSDKSFSIIFNGEIYNYRELRLELELQGYFFRTESDTEVLLTAWQCWGSECLSRLVGMFAFVVFDSAKNLITCVRDAFGIKPFFYTQENGNFISASEIPAIKALKQEKISLNWQCAYDYLVHGHYDNGEKSFIDNVFHLLPGYLLEFDLHDNFIKDIKEWWRPNVTERTDLNFSQATELVRERFLDNIRLHLRSDVPIGSALSGGIDSSAVVCAMRYTEPDMPINTFSYIAKGSEVSEEVWVDKINEYTKAIPHKVSVDVNELVTDLEDMILAQGEPFGSTSIYAQYRVFKLARENGVKVTLDGQGADEMLAGYSGYPGQRVCSLLDNREYRAAWRFLDKWAEWPGRSRYEGLKLAVAEFTDGGLYHILRRLDGKQALPKWINQAPLEERDIIQRYPRQRYAELARGRRVISELALSLTKRGIPPLLRHGDRNSMRFSVESRVPFLTIDMVNLLLSLPESFLISPEGETKHVFRAAMRGIVPNGVLDRRDKIGFATPEQEWMRLIVDVIRKWLKVDLGLPFLNQQELMNEFELIIAGKKPFSWIVWRWINFSRWYVNLVL